MKQQQQGLQVQKKQLTTTPLGFSLPALEISAKNYSLDADMINGWQPKIKVIGPIPLNFDAAIIDEVVQTLSSFPKQHRQRVIYLGSRYASSFKLQQEIRREYAYKHQNLINTSFSHLNAYFRKFYAHFKAKHARPFHGNHPSNKSCQVPIFDSTFQSGNLDAAIKVGQNQYDLFMRVDTNTKGHMQWYNFTIKNNNSKKIRLNIVNFRKFNTLYNQSLRPYVMSSHPPYRKWKQGGSNVKFGIKMLRYTFLSDIFASSLISYNCLSFEYEFSHGQELVQFAYCVPFTYSNNNSMIYELKKKVHSFCLYNENDYFLKQEVLCQSLGGLDIPLITITDPSLPQQHKKCIFVTARIHPGETCGSYMVKGLLEYLCSDNQEAKYLRKTSVFKIIPMTNPDGVVVGNFRTSLCGRDLNRMFKCEDSLLIPQVKAIKQLVIKLKQQYKNRLLFFLDFHGHSTKKNVFLYGPEYEIWQNNYYKTRIVPKLIAEKTEIFRYYSCLFRIAEWKKKTARAVILTHVPHCYTIEASVGSYYSSSQKKQIQFEAERWQFMGKTITECISEYLQILQYQKQRHDRKGKDIKKQMKKTGKIVISTESKLPKINQKQFQQFQLSQQTSEAYRNAQSDLMSKRSRKNEEAMTKLNSLMEQIKKQEELKMANSKQKMDESIQDSESENEEEEDKALSYLHQEITVSLKEFKARFYAKSKFDSEITRPKNFLRSSASVHKRSIEMIASLRKKPEEYSEIKQQKPDTPQKTKAKPKSLFVRQNWPKSRVQNNRKYNYQHGEAKSFQVYVNKINFSIVSEKQQKSGIKISYLSPRRKKYPQVQLE